MIGPLHVLFLAVTLAAAIVLVAALHNTETYIRTWWYRRRHNRKP